MYCRVQVHGRPSSARRKARERCGTPSAAVIGGEHPTELAGVGSAAVSTPRSKAQVVPGPGSSGWIQDRLRGGGEGLAAVPHSEHAISPGAAQGSG